MFSVIFRLSGKQKESSSVSLDQASTKSFLRIAHIQLKVQQALSILMYEGVIKLTSVMFFAPLLRGEVRHG